MLPEVACGKGKAAVAPGCRASRGPDDLYIGKGNRLSSFIDDLSLYEGQALSKG